MLAKSLDVFVLLKLVNEQAGRTYQALGRELGMSASEVHASVRRSAEAGLIEPEHRKVLRKPLEEYLIHGVRYAFPAKRGSVTRGILTAVGAPPLSANFAKGHDILPVWPDPLGDAIGYSLEPLHRSAPFAARSDSSLYQLLALVDAIRDGRAREREAAATKLRALLAHG